MERLWLVVVHNLFFYGPVLSCFILLGQLIGCLKAPNVSTWPFRRLLSTSQWRDARGAALCADALGAAIERHHLPCVTRRKIQDKTWGSRFDSLKSDSFWAFSQLKCDTAQDFTDRSVDLLWLRLQVEAILEIPDIANERNCVFAASAPLFASRCNRSFRRHGPHRPCHSRTGRQHGASATMPWTQSWYFLRPHWMVKR